MEINAISEKLKMILQINKEECYPKQLGVPHSCVSGHQYDQWMVERNIINEFWNDMKDKKKKVGMSSKKVFIVHGHDDLAKLEVARLIERFDLETIILHEQPNSGSTIIEKIEENSDAGYAVVLYTPCDVGRAKEKNVDEEQPRARQNVVFEHGYLIGKLGRHRVTALVKGMMESPGDVSGVVYISMDKAGAWKTELAREMKNAGLEVDMNRL